MAAHATAVVTGRPAIIAVRALSIGRGDTLAPALGTVALLAGLLLVFVPLAVRAFRRADRAQHAHAALQCAAMRPASSAVAS